MLTASSSSIDGLNKNPLLKRHKFPARISGGQVIHEWNDERCDAWVWKKRIGTGASGLVILQGNEKTGELRAVKRLWMGPTVERELTHLISVMDRQDLFVHLRGWYEWGGFVYCVMEYHEHGDLGQYIKRNQDQAHEEAREISKQILEALEELHKRQICHRDLKPQNILVTSLSPTRIKLTDFGLSKCHATSQMGTLGVGTLGYIAPEMIPLAPPIDGCQPYSDAIDMWAFGCVVYLLLTGKQPFEPNTYFPMEALREFCEGDRGTMFGCITDDGARDFVGKLLVPNPDERMSASQALNHPWITSAQFTKKCVNQLCFTESSTAPEAYATTSEDPPVTNPLPADTPRAPSPLFIAAVFTTATLLVVFYCVF